MSKIEKIQQNTHDIIIATVNEEGKVADSMADPKVCVALDGTTVEEMTDEAARANLAGADMVEVRFDRLYLIKPDLQSLMKKRAKRSQHLLRTNGTLQMFQLSMWMHRLHRSKKGYHYL